MRIKYWSSDVCSSDLRGREGRDMERGDGRAAAIAHRHRKRAKAKLEFFLDEAPALLGDAGEFGAERRLVDERALGTPIQCGGGAPCRTPGPVRRGEQHPPHPRAMARTRANGRAEWRARVRWYVEL